MGNTKTTKGRGDRTDASDPRRHYARYLIALPGDRGKKKTYLKWLESQFQSLVHAHAHPDADEAGRMGRSDAEGMILQRVYDACCLAERFEPSGKFRGNGHHFAQRMSRHVADAFLKQWGGNEPCEGCSFWDPKANQDAPCATEHVPSIRKMVGGCPARRP